jgi:ABC-type sugar transport system substrate-binding protein
MPQRVERKLSYVINTEETSMRSLFLVSILLLGFAATVPQADAADVRMFIRHEVTDYATWRKAYDAFDATRKKLGVTGQAVYQSLDNANDVTVTHDFKTADKAKAFASSPDLKTTMEKAGVKGAPQIWFTTSAAK